MTDDILTLNESGELSVRTTSSAGDTSTNNNDVYTRDSQGRLALRVVGATGGGSGDYVRQYAEMPEPTSAGDIVQYIGSTAPYSHGAFYESVNKISGSNQYTDFYGHVDVSVDNKDTMFKFINAVLEHAGKSPLAVGDSVKIQQLIDDVGFPLELWIEITPTGGVADRTDVDIEWLMSLEDFTQSGLGFSMSGTEDYMTFKVSGIATTTVVWQETTVDVALEAIVENYGSILKSPVELASGLGGTKKNVSGLTALFGLDSRPSHIAEGAVVVDDYGRIGIVDSISRGRVNIVTVYIPVAPETDPFPSGATIFKLLGTNESNQKTWMDGLLFLTDTQATASAFTDKMWIAKSTTGSLVKNQTYMYVAEQQEVYNARGYVDNYEMEIYYDLTVKVDAEKFESVIPVLPDGGLSLYYDGVNYQSSNSESSLTIAPADLSAVYGITLYDEYGEEVSAEQTGAVITIMGKEIQTVNTAVSQGTAPIVSATDSSSTYAFDMPSNMVQMGGIVEVGSLNASVAVGNIPVVLPVACKNGNYVPTITVITDGTFKQIIADVANRTTTGFEICVRNIDTEAASNVKIAWSVVGLKG